MSNEFALGLVSSAVVIVPKAIEKIEEGLPVLEAQSPPSVMTLDLTSGLYSYSFTLGDLVTTVAIFSTITFLTLAVMKYIRGDQPKRREGD